MNVTQDSNEEPLTQKVRESIPKKSIVSEELKSEQDN